MSSKKLKYLLAPVLEHWNYFLKSYGETLAAMLRSTGKAGSKYNLIGHLGSPGTKSDLDVGLVERHEVYYKGEGGDFPQVRAVMSLVSLNCPWLVLAPKVLQLCTNHLVLVLCKFA